MKKLQLVLNIVLSTAVIALFVLYFTGIGKPGKSNSASFSSTGADGNGKIRYIQLDTVLAKYKMAIDLTDELQKKYNSSEAALQSRQSDYEKEVNDYQYKVQRGLVTRTDAQNIEQTLYAKQQDLLQLQQQLSSEINEQNVVMNNQVINALTEYLKEHYSKLDCQYILGTTFGGAIMYAHDSLDISNEVIEGLNEKYDADKKNK